MKNDIFECQSEGSYCQKYTIICAKKSHGGAAHIWMSIRCCC